MRRSTAHPRRGSALIHVLMLGVLMLLIATLLMKMVMHRAQVGHSTSGGVVAKAQTDAGVANAISGWSQSGVGINCQSVSGVISCSGTPDSCSCRCTITGSNAVVFAVVDGTNCRICACIPKFLGEQCPASTISDINDCR